MKKLLKSVLALSMMFAVSACGGAQKTTSSEEAWKAQLVEEGKLSIAVSPDYPPYENLTTDGQIEGFDYDMGNALAKDLGVEVEWVQMGFDSIVGSVNAGQVDLGIAGFTYDKERNVEWSDPYYTSKQVAVVAKGSAITDTKSLEGKKIGCQLGTTGETCANDVKDAEVVAIKDAKVLFTSLSANAYDAIIIDVAVADSFAASGSYTILDGSLLDEENFIISKKGNTDLMTKVNEFIKNYKESNDYKEAVSTWFGK